jgi:hypothetical protein
MAIAASAQLSAEVMLGHVILKVSCTVHNVAAHHQQLSPAKQGMLSKACIMSAWVTLGAAPTSHLRGSVAYLAA